MARFLTSLVPALLLLAATACEPAERPHDAADTMAATARDSMTPGEPRAHSTTGHAAAGEGGQALLSIMQHLGREMTTLTYALMTDDFDKVTQSAAAIADHAPISADELERIHSQLGTRMAVFEAVDESVHVASVRLHDAARSRQLDQVVERLGDVQRGCVSCHVQFRERLRTNPVQPADR